LYQNKFKNWEFDKEAMSTARFSALPFVGVYFKKIFRGLS
jgi:hypothetical protein